MCCFSLLCSHMFDFFWCEAHSHVAFPFFSPMKEFQISKVQIFWKSKSWTFWNSKSRLWKYQNFWKFIFLNLLKFQNFIGRWNSESLEFWKLSCEFSKAGIVISKSCTKKENCHKWKGTGHVTFKNRQFASSEIACKGLLARLPTSYLYSFCTVRRWYKHKRVQLVASTSDSQGQMRIFLDDVWDLYNWSPPMFH